MSGETVLWYCPDPVLSQKIGKLFLTLRLRVRRAAPEDLGEQVGYLLGMKGYAASGQPGKAPAPGEPILVFSGLGPQRLDALLAGLRKAGATIPCKAAATPTNVSWTLEELYRELRREHESLGGK